MMRFWKHAPWVGPKKSGGIENWTAVFAGIMLAVIAISSGCDGNSVEGKASLHEMDHAVAPHWPESLGDAADKIRERIGMLDGDSTAGSGVDTATDARQELLDILSWVPEIAADTDMSEATWVPLAEESENLHARLKKEKFSDQLGEQMLDFADVIATAWDTGDSDDT